MAFVRPEAILVGILTLAGCATPAKPILPEADYDGLAGTWFGIQHCVAQGHMAPEIGAQGRNQIQDTLRTYSFDHARMDALGTKYTNWAPERAWCNTAAMVIAQKTPQRVAGNTPTNPIPDDVSWIKNGQRTYCNRIGTQTLCTTN